MMHEERILVEKLVMLWQPDARENDLVSMTDEEQLDLLARLTVLRSAGAVFGSLAGTGEEDRDDFFARLASLREAIGSLMFYLRFAEAHAASTGGADHAPRSSAHLS